MFIAMSRWSGSVPLVSGTPSSLYPHQIPLGYPVSTLSLGDPEAIIPQAQSIHQLLQVLDGVDARVDQPKAWPWARLVAAGQSRPLGIPASGESAESAPLEPCLQGWFSLACGCGVGATSPACRGQLSCYSVQ